MLESAPLGCARSIPVTDSLKETQNDLRGKENGTIHVRNEHVVYQTGLLHHRNGFRPFASLICCSVSFMTRIKYKRSESTCVWNKEPLQSQEIVVLQNIGIHVQLVGVPTNQHNPQLHISIQNTEGGQIIDPVSDIDFVLVLLFVDKEELVVAV